MEMNGIFISRGIFTLPSWTFQSDAQLDTSTDAEGFDTSSTSDDESFVLILVPLLPFYLAYSSHCEQIVNISHFLYLSFIRGVVGDELQRKELWSIAG